MTNDSFERLRAEKLASWLVMIEDAENAGDYGMRFDLVIAAILDARKLGMRAGFGYDSASGPDMDGFRVVAYIELPTRQVSWHMPEHEVPHDGHTTPEKRERCRAYIMSVES